MPLQTLPPTQWPLVDGQKQTIIEWYRYFSALDAVLRTNTLGPLTNAANDAAAAAAGVPLNGLYRNANAVQVRLT